MAQPGQAVIDELLAAVAHNIRTRPRDLQTWIGPSEVGEECPRALIAKVMEVRARPEPPNWKATVGTAVHELLERMFRDARYLREVRVMVGHIGGREVWGNVDLYDLVTHTVIDWKTKSRAQMRNHRRNGPGQKYIVQAQCYGLGLSMLGLPVSVVGDIFMPRDGEFADSFGWSAPFDPRIGAEAIARADRMHTLATTFGVKAAQQQFPQCNSEWCRTCADPNKIRPGLTRVSSTDNPFALAV